MKLKLILAAIGLLFAFNGFTQGIEKGSGVLYTNGVPSHTPDTLTEAEIAINFATGYWYEYSRDSAAWLKAGYRVQEKSGACGAPTYTPQDKQSLVVVDTCGQIYVYYNGTWKKSTSEPSDGDKGDITVSGSGTVWNIDANTIGPTELASTAVLPGTYTNVSITVDADGRITSASTLPLGKRGIYDGSFNTGDSVVTAEVRKELRYVSDSTDAVFAVDMTPGLYGTQVTVTADSLKLYFYDVSGSNELSLGPVGILMKTSSLRPLTIQGDAAKYAANYAPFSAREIPDFAAVEAAIAGNLQTVDSLYVSGDSLYISLSLDSIPSIAVNLDQFLDNTDTSGYNSLFTRSNDTLYLTDGDGTLFVKLPPGSVDTDDQTLTWNGATGELSISEGNTVDLDGRYLQSEVDGSTTNELQTIDTFSLSGNILSASLSSDGQPTKTVDLSAYLDNTDAQTLSIDSTIVGNSERFALTISGGNIIRFDIPQGIFLTDGDKGDIDVSSSGTIWTVDTSAITMVKIAANAVDSTKIINGGVSVLDIGQNGASSGQVLRWNGTAWTAAGINNYDLVTSSQTVSAAINQVFVNTITANITLNLAPCSAANDGVKFEFVKMGTDTFAVIIDPSGVEQFFDGAADKRLYSRGTSISCTCRWNGSSGTWLYIMW